MAESAEAEARAAQDAEAAAAVPTPAGSDPAGTPGTRPATSAIFAEVFGYTPAQIGELTTGEFDALVDYLHETGKLRD